jgi:outer membrane protein assembly factor BamB
MQRSVLITAIVVIVGVGFMLASQPASSPSVSSQAAAGSPQNSANIPSTWLMEGSNPARTRNSPHSVAVPLTQRRQIGVAGVQNSGSPPIVAGGMVLVERDDALLALDLQTGKQRWQFADEGSYISPAVAGDLVFIRAEAANKGHVYALDLHSGKQRWAFAPKRFSSSETSYYGGHLTSPAIEGDTLFVGAGKEIYALDIASGKTRWEFATQEYITSSAAIADGNVYFSDLKFAYAIDQHTGAKRWAVPVQTAFSFSPVATTPAVLVSSGDALIALDPATGTQRWRYAVPSETLIPAGADSQRAYIKSTGTLYALDLLTGKEVWRYRNTEFVSLPAVAGNQLVVISGMSANAALTILDSASGKRSWSQPVTQLDTTAPVIAGAAVYVRTTDGRVLAFQS